MQIVTELKMQRILRSLSQTELGSMIGVSQTYITMLEGLKAIPSLEKSKALEDIFDIPIHKLLSVARSENIKDNDRTC